MFEDELTLLHISPKYALARRLAAMPNIRYVAGEIDQRRWATIRFDITRLPFASNVFDAVICIHVLEHVEDDLVAMSELFRVIRPGGWALITVPLRLDQPTHEDPHITSPQERARAFGEADHVRLYGSDITDRLRARGFKVSLDRASEIGSERAELHGLRDDENVLFCRKPSRCVEDTGGRSPS